MTEPCQHPEAVVVDVASDGNGRRISRVRLRCAVCGVEYAETRDDPDGQIAFRAYAALSAREILRPMRQLHG